MTTPRRSRFPRAPAPAEADRWLDDGGPDSRPPDGPRPPAPGRGDAPAGDRTGALVLTRHAGQDFHLDLGDGRRVRVTLTGQHGTQTRICIEAPMSVAIWRGELPPPPPTPPRR